jgi:hypothetical protein
MGPRSARTLKQDKETNMLDKLKALVKALNPIAALKRTLKDAAKKVVTEEGDQLQARLKEALAKEGPGAIDKVLDGAQAALLSRIEAL